LANGIGNLTSRILKMATSNSIGLIGLNKTYKSYKEIDQFKLNDAVHQLWQKITACDVYIQQNEPFKKIKVDVEAGKKDIEYLLGQLNQIAISLQAFLPQTAEQIIKALNEPTLENIPRLFPRI
jgi:methionyl-tRNA synthetase